MGGNNNTYSSRIEPKKKHWNRLVGLINTMKVNRVLTLAEINSQLTTPIPQKNMYNYLQMMIENGYIAKPQQNTYVVLKHIEHDPISAYRRMKIKDEFCKVPGCNNKKESCQDCLRDIAIESAKNQLLQEMSLKQPPEIFNRILQKMKEIPPDNDERLFLFWEIQKKLYGPFSEFQRKITDLVNEHLKIQYPNT